MFWSRVVDVSVLKEKEKVSVCRGKNKLVEDIMRGKKLKRDLKYDPMHLCFKKYEGCFDLLLLSITSENLKHLIFYVAFSFTVFYSELLSLFTVDLTPKKEPCSTSIFFFLVYNYYGNLLLWT